MDTELNDIFSELANDKVSLPPQKELIDFSESFSKVFSQLTHRETLISFASMEDVSSKDLINRFISPAMISSVRINFPFENEIIFIFPSDLGGYLSEVNLNPSAITPPQEITQEHQNIFSDSIRGVVADLSNYLNEKYNLKIEFGEIKTSISFLQESVDNSKFLNSSPLVMITYLIKVEGWEEWKFFKIASKYFLDEIKNYISLPSAPSISEPLIKPIEEKQDIITEQKDEEVSPPLSLKNLDMLSCVPVEISVLLGSTEMRLGEIMELGMGSIINLKKKYNEPIELRVYGKKIGIGEVMVLNEKFAIKILELKSK